MADIETVKKGLECCLRESGKCGDCPYQGGSVDGSCIDIVQEEALDLLKEKEPIKANKIGVGWFCGRCEEFLTTNDDKRIKFCWSCGTPVLWEKRRWMHGKRDLPD